MNSGLLNGGGSREVRNCSGGDRSGFVPPKRVGALATPFHFGPAVSLAPLMQRVLTTLARLATTELTITLVGETGTGKDVLAQAVHAHSQRANGPFVVFDCGAVAENLAESELFGYERGAFTGATSAHTGAFERAHGGTLFLDEVGELPLNLQPRLLRALENRVVQRVGGKEYRPVDLRVIAATNRDLAACVANRTFREDLFFRLSTAIVHVPALRQRIEDLSLLIPLLLQDLGRSDLEPSPATYAVLAAHSWPGNVRELKNTLASASAFVEGSVLEPKHLLFMGPPSAAVGLEQLHLGGQTLESLERAAIEQTLARHNGNQIETAEVLGISLSVLLEKLEKLGI